MQGIISLQVLPRHRFKTEETQQGKQDCEQEGHPVSFVLHGHLNLGVMFVAGIVQMLVNQ